MELFLKLVTVIISSYTLVHPKDLNPDKMRRFSKCSDVLQTYTDQFAASSKVDSSQLYQLDIHDSLSKDLQTIFVDKLEQLSSY
jgi:hypothetical protein